jgi:hypothetical protein
VLQPLDVAVFGPLKMHLTIALSHLNEAQLLRIHKSEWMDAYIKAREAAFSISNINSAWRGCGLQPFQPQRCIRAATHTTYVEPRPRTLTEHDIFDKVFENSSPPDFQTLCKANTVLNTALESVHGILNTPTTRKLADKTEQLNTQHFLHEKEVENLRSIIQKHKAQTNVGRGVDAAMA